jgi:predicted dehydrogenase
MPASVRGAVMTPKVAVLSFAHGHVGVYCDQWSKSGEVEIVAGWDHDASRVKPNVKAFATPQAAVEHADAVAIGVETSMHTDLVELAADAGKTIILQKPLALTLDQADRMIAAVARNNIRFTLAWQMRVDPQNLEMKRLIETGTIGRVYMVRRRHGLSTHTWPNFENTWHVKPELNRGMWADDACHAIDFLYWLLGMPQSVMAEIDTLRSPKVPDDHGIAIFRYKDGTFAEVVSSFTCLAGENTTEIVGENGVIIQNYGDGPSTLVPHPPGGLKWILKGEKDWTVSPIASPASHGERIAALAPELAKFLRGERPPICTAEEGRDVLRMTLASYESAQRGCRVRVSSSSSPGTPGEAG